MSRVVHFEIHCENPERAIKFYAAVFGWEITKWDGPADYWLVRTGDPKTPGIDGGLLRRPCPTPGGGQGLNAYACTVDVASVDRTIATVTAHGGTIALPKMAIPGVGWLVYFIDTEGNTFGAMQRDPAAK
jgi:predicted enzyme related to lactoylglutathione lyase